MHSATLLSAVRAKPVRLLEFEDVDSAMATGGAQQGGLHLQGGERQGMDGGRPGPTSE